MTALGQSHRSSQSEQRKGVTPGAAALTTPPHDTLIAVTAVTLVRFGLPRTLQAARKPRFRRSAKVTAVTF